jgi:predicted TIM-barrel fold metal-dependent hydrolase
LKSLEAIGVDRVTYESDYPHSDSTWPNTRQIAEEQMQGLDDDTITKIVRGNAIKMLGLDADGRWRA